MESSATEDQSSVSEARVPLNFQTLPKAEIHIHLEGCFDTEMLESDGCLDEWGTSLCCCIFWPVN